jgi:hypothetical protein
MYEQIVNLEFWLSPGYATSHFPHRKLREQEFINEIYLEDKCMPLNYIDQL